MDIAQQLEKYAQNNTKQLCKNIKIVNEELYRDIQNLPLYRCDRSHHIPSILKHRRLYSAKTIHQKNMNFTTNEEYIDQFFGLDRYVFVSLGYLPKKDRDIKRIYGSVISVYSNQILQKARGYLSKIDIADDRQMFRLSNALLDQDLTKEIVWKKNELFNFGQYKYFQTFYTLDAVHLYLYQEAKKRGIKTIETFIEAMRRRIIASPEIKIQSSISTKHLEVMYVSEKDFHRDIQNKISDQWVSRIIIQGKESFNIPRCATKLIQKNIS